MFQLGAYRNRQQAVQMQELARRNSMNTQVETAQINGQTGIGPAGPYRQYPDCEPLETTAFRYGN
ncbi:MAG: hypothetical protein R3E95_08805 [Thiolinea sp.]